MPGRLCRFTLLHDAVDIPRCQFQLFQPAVFYKGIEHIAQVGSIRRSAPLQGSSVLIIQPQAAGLVAAQCRPAQSM